MATKRIAMGINLRQNKITGNSGGNDGGDNGGGGGDDGMQI